MERGAPNEELPATRLGITIERLAPTLFAFAPRTAMVDVAPSTIPPGPMRLLAALILLPAALAAQATPSARATAVTILDEAIARQGGDSALRAIRTARLDVMTQWQRFHFGTHPYADGPSYERHQDLRDYASAAWRNSRTFIPSGAAVDIVRDTVAGRTLVVPGGATQAMALNSAYVQERRELFAFAPERTLLLARAAHDLRRIADTIIDGARHRRVSATVDGFPATWAIRERDGLLAMVRFSADEDADFGLAPYGVQEVEMWFSAWRRLPPGVMYPMQRDVRRVGRPYKRMTAISAVLNAPAPPDSFAIADSIVAQYLATQRGPMWDASLDATQVTENAFVAFPPFIGTSAAIRVGGSWVLVETGQSRGAAAKSAAWLERTTGTKVGAGIVTMPSTSNGGAAWFAEQRLPLYAAPGAVPMLRAMLGATRAARASAVEASRWVRVGNDSLWLERLELPDLNGALAVYSPTHRWLYFAILGTPQARAEQEALVARLRARGLPVEWVANVRAIRTPAP